MPFDGFSGLFWEGFWGACLSDLRFFKYFLGIFWVAFFCDVFWVALQGVFLGTNFGLCFWITFFVSAIFGFLLLGGLALLPFGSVLTDLCQFNRPFGHFGSTFGLFLSKGSIFIPILAHNGRSRAVLNGF